MPTSTVLEINVGNRTNFNDSLTLVTQAVSGETRDHARTPYHSPEMIKERLLSRASNSICLYFVLFLFIDMI